MHVCFTQIKERVVAAPGYSLLAKAQCVPGLSSRRGGGPGDETIIVYTAPKY